MAKSIGHFINGEQTNGSGLTTQAITNSATGQVLAQVELADRKLVQEAIDGAQYAADEWKQISPLKRSRLLSNFKTLLESHRNELSERICLENGKTQTDAQGEIQRGIEIVEFATAIPQLLKGEYSENVGKDIDTFSCRQALGVVAGVTPFNFPAMVPLWMFPLALACGNSFIVKPSEQTPSASLLMAKLLKEAGFPDGVFQVVNGDKAAVDALIESPQVRALSFVGSTPVAKAVYEKAARFGKRVQALGGAKNHGVILPDADLEKTADAILGASFGSAGQRCMALSVAVVVDPIHEQFANILSEKSQNLQLGAWSDTKADLGPLISATHRDSLLQWIETGTKEGAKLLTDGRKHLRSEGYFLGPTIFDHVTSDMSIYREEVFGPVLCILRVKDLEEAMVLINRHPYGNGASIFTESGTYARLFASRIQAGMVGVNIPLPVPMAYHSFGGWKESRFGDSAIYGMEGVRFYTNLKTITQRWSVGREVTSSFAMPTSG